MKKSLWVSIATAVISAVIYHYVNEIIHDIADGIEVDKDKFNFEMDGVNNDL